MDERKLKELIGEILQIPVEEITLETAFADLDADSLDLYRIIDGVEEVFGLEIPVEDADKIRTVGDALSQIRK